MRIIEIAQGSEEWLALRRSKITATDCAAILGKSKYKSPYMVWLDKMGKSKQVDNEAMERGRRLEPEAREYFSKKLGMKFEPAVVISDENPWQMASLDGWNEENGVILEIKCPGEPAFREAQAGKIPEEYVLQCLHQLAVCDKAVQNRLCFYFEGIYGIETVEMAIGRDETEIVDLTAKERAFYQNHVLQFVEPPLGELDYQQREDEEWSYLCGQWRTIKKQMAEDELEEKALRDELISLAASQNCRGAGVQLTKYVRQGNVEYSRVPELKGIDLTPYRKPSIEAWRLSEIENKENS